MVRNTAEYSTLANLAHLSVSIRFLIMFMPFMSILRLSRAALVRAGPSKVRGGSGEKNKEDPSPDTRQRVRVQNMALSAKG